MDSLLIGRATMECSKATFFFLIFHNIYIYIFVGSTDRYDMLYQALEKRITGTKERPIICKIVSITKRTSRFEAIKSLNKGFLACQKVLLQLLKRN